MLSLTTDSRITIGNQAAVLEEFTYYHAVLIYCFFSDLLNLRPCSPYCIISFQILNDKLLNTFVQSFVQIQAGKSEGNIMNDFVFIHKYYKNEAMKK